MTPNPYEPPRADCRHSKPIEAPTRQSLALTVRAFLAEEITAFAFDERLDAFRDSDDPVIAYVVEAVWFHYDDCDDHLVCLSKPEWDYFQRLLLVLESDCRFEKVEKRTWSLRQPIAAAALCAFVLLAVKTGWGYHLLAVAIPFGVVSIALANWRSRHNDETPYQEIIHPFASFSDLATAYRSSKFRKTQYPIHLAHRAVRSPLMEAIGQLHCYLAWLILSPVPLFCQMIPENRSRTRFTAG